MNYIEPLTSNLSVTYDGITYTVNYYKPATTTDGVIDESHPDWLAGTTYNSGDYVIVPELKRIYRSAIDSNLGVFPLSDNTKWVDYGAINSFRAFSSDADIGAKTSGADGFLEFDFSRSNAISFIDLDFVSANFMLIRTDLITYLGLFNPATSYSVDERVYYGFKLYKALTNNIGEQPDTSPTHWEEDTDNVYFNQEDQGVSIGCYSYGEYFYTDAEKVTRQTIRDLEWLPSSVFRVDFSGSWSVGTIGYGNLSDLGCTLTESQIRYQSNSKISTSEVTGYRNVLRFGKVRIIECDVAIDSELFGDTLSKGDDLIDKNIIWIPTKNDKFRNADTIGYIEKMDVPMNNDDKFKTKLTIIGVSK